MFEHHTHQSLPDKQNRNNDTVEHHKHCDLNCAAGAKSATGNCVAFGHQNKEKDKDGVTR